MQYNEEDKEALNEKIWQMDNIWFNRCIYIRFYLFSIQKEIIFISTHYLKDYISFEFSREKQFLL